jgi:uncharacterized protein
MTYRILKNRLDRRRFLEAGLMSAAASLVPPFASAEQGKKSTGVRSISELRSLPPGAVKPEGWLRIYLEKQARQLGLHLPEVSWPFTGAYWAGEEKAKSWWPWEQKGYWIDGALRCALVLGDKRLLEVAQAPVDYTLDHPFPDGYLGPAFSKDAKEKQGPEYDNFRWPHAVFFRALAAKSEATKDPSIALPMQKHFLSDHAPYGGASRDVTNVEGMLWAYERTGDKRLLAMAEKAWNDFTRSAEPGDRESGDLHPDRVFANTPIHAHGVTYIEKAKLPAILYMYTGNEEDLRFALAAQNRVFNHHMLIDGIPSSTEDYRDTTSLDAHETCDISDHTWSWGYLLMATGDGVWGDRIERAVFNAGFGAIKKDWKAVQYFSCPNQVLATQDSNHAPMRDGRSKGWMSYRPNPGQGVACCGGNVHRFFPNYVIRMWMRDANGGLAATLYGASRVQVEVGRERQSVQIQEETDYPFGEEIHFTVQCDKPVLFRLSFRIPGWCATPSFFLNEKPIPLPPIRNGFAFLKRTFHPGDKVTLVLPMKTALTYSVDDGIGIERGPLVFSLPIKEEWTPVVETKWSTPEFPGWDAVAATPWNYGIGVDETKLLSQIEVKRNTMTADPWVEPPISLVVPLKKIPGWDLRSDPKNPTYKLTPPLPEPTEDLAVEKESISLVPYGATHLRLTIFPKAVRS